MKCLACGGATAVYDTRIAADGSIRRRRECVTCGARFTTVEAVVATGDGLRRAGPAKNAVLKAARLSKRAERG